MQNVLSELTSSNWDKKFTAIDNIRRLAVFHSAVLKPHLKSVVNTIAGDVENLRSSIAKNAILCINDLCTFMQRNMVLLSII